MASECDHTLLGEDSERAVDVSAPRRKRTGVLVASVIGAVASTAVWKFSAGGHPTSFGADGVMSAVRENPRWGVTDLGFISATCASSCRRIGKTSGAVLTPMSVQGFENTQAAEFWPRHFNDVNWIGHCKPGNPNRNCKERILEKFVGDYFDAWVQSADCKGTNFIPTDMRELERWKKRAVDAVFKAAKLYDARHRIPFMFLEGDPPKEWAPKWDTPGGKETFGLVCDSIFDGGFLVTKAQARDAKCEGKGQPNYAVWNEAKGMFRTSAPEDTANLCYMSAKNPAVPCSTAPVLPTYDFPAELDPDSTILEGCKHLLKQFPHGEDWINAAVTTLDVRECIMSGGSAPRHPRSRSWTKACIPGGDSANQRKYGWPGFVFEFVAEYGIPLTDCNPDYDGLLDAPGPCPSLCDSGGSLAGALQHALFLNLDVPYKVIFNAKPPGGIPPIPAMYQDLDLKQHHHAKHVIYTEGPVVGLVVTDVSLAACTNDGVIYTPADDPFFDGNIARLQRDGDITKGMLSVVTHGWGSLAGVHFYRITSSFHNDARIVERALKVFIYPNAADADKGDDRKWFSNSLRKFKAEYSCKRSPGFCRQPGAGYTATEDCDGDGVLDHWCYAAGDAKTPTYEAFISSRSSCETLQQSCRRSVLPGRTFGCQRPLGWCMNGEAYRRDQDCDGDGHLDHVCETRGHSGFISSSMDCIDTWEEGKSGRKCEPRPIIAEKSDLPYKLVLESGECVKHTTPQCFQSHADWPRVNYPQEICQMTVDWDAPPGTPSDCGKPVDSNESLWLELVHWDVETAHFKDTGGFAFGDRLTFNEYVADPIKSNVDGQYIRMYFPVQPKTQIRWETDLSVEEEGWLVCLRLMRNIPETYVAACSEIGTDLTSRLLFVEDPKNFVQVECDMTKCRKSETYPIRAGKKNEFLLTTNVCDAGWQVTKSSKFVLDFHTTRIAKGARNSEALQREQYFVVTQT